MIIPDEELIEKDVNAYLEQHWRKDLLRFLTCGSVDDGKSTLIGRLLYDSKMIYEDQLAAVRHDSRNCQRQSFHSASPTPQSFLSNTLPMSLCRRRQKDRFFNKKFSFFMVLCSTCNIVSNYHL